MLRVYLAGPDVFWPNALEIAQAKEAICAAHGLAGRAPFNAGLDTSLPQAALWRRIFADNAALMREADAVIANLTPFRGASADAGTLVEIGWFWGAGKTVFGYSNDPAPFAQRTRALCRAWPDEQPGMAVEEFGLGDNLMIPGAIEASGGLFAMPEDHEARAFDDLGVFEALVKRVAGWEAGAAR
ncbi:nucleoside 2-deoxyribosyltransferase [Acidocella sp.]|uniref:nucleoside 2-deoxyribosyltransferase n=1 Tax=Acidocella sp. TaxID=50710 RepID=UPI002614456F|nr:nucleoside 2-deoxyribosyltransferase [Acidocella sp.]